MFDLTLRALALGLRFSCPLLILAISTQENLGHYYLFSSFFTMAAVFIAMEIGTPFSEKYAKCNRTRSKQLIFNHFLLTQILIASTLSIPFSLIYFTLYQPDHHLILILAALFTSEACVNEVGRFYWNIGLAKEASLRDFFRAVSFTAAIFLAVLLKNEVINTLSLSLLTFFNVLIAIHDHRRFGAAPFRLRPSCIRVRHLRRIIHQSGRQFLHMQIILSQAFVERMLLEKKLGLSVLGVFAFQTTLIQASSALFLMPMISKTRSIIFSTRTGQTRVAHLSALSLALKFTCVCGAMALFVQWVAPHVPLISRKLTGIEPYTIPLSALIAIASGYAAAVAPLFCRIQQSWIANVQSLVAVGILLLPLASSQKLTSEYIWLTLTISYGLQLMLRLRHFIHALLNGEPK